MLRLRGALNPEFVRRVFAAPRLVFPRRPLPSFFAVATAARLSTTAAQDPVVDFASQIIRLRDYQEECIGSVLTSLEKGHKRLGISLATGAGKTVIFTQLIDRVQPLSEDATQTLILAHRRELVEQAARHCTRAYPGKSIEIEMGNLSASGTADITIASVQSIVSKDRLLKFHPDRFKLILVDEAHHIVAPGYLKILEHFGLSSKNAESPPLVGVSATFSRLDGLRLGAAIDEIVYHKDYVDMIGGKWLSDVIFTTVESTVDFSAVTTKKGNRDFDLDSLSLAVNTDEVNTVIVQTWFSQASERKSTLVFCVDIAHVRGLTHKFRSHGIDARFVTGETPNKERSERLDAFRKGEFPVLVNCGVFTEGTDIPNIDCVLLARPTRSRNLLIQMIGRGMRLHPGKENCHIIDMVSSLETGIVTTPTLFGLDPGELVTETSVAGMQELRDRKEAERARKIDDETHENRIVQDNASSLAPRADHTVTLTQYDSIFDLITDTSGEKHIRAISPYAWVQVGPHRYILSGPSGTYLKLEKEEIPGYPSSALFKAWEVRALPPGLSKSPYAAPRELLVAHTFDDAVHGCDKYASEKFPRPFILWRMRWRDGPPTDGQLKMLNKLRSKDDQLTVNDITKGKAGDMITKLKHGARGRFSSIQEDAKRKARVNILKQREQARKWGESVSVGPVLA